MTLRFGFDTIVLLRIFDRARLYRAQQTEAIARLKHYLELYELYDKLVCSSNSDALAEINAEAARLHSRCLNRFK
jgi:hypothetical protein